MRVPIRKPGQYTHYKPDPHITAAKLEAYKIELSRLKSNRPKLADEVKRLAELGDFSENAEYQIAKCQLRGINARIDELETLIKKANIITAAQTDQVQLGHRVTIELNGVQKQYQLLGSQEADPGKGIISQTSPLGAALVGKRVGEIFTVTLGGKETTGEIISIEKN